LEDWQEDVKPELEHNVQDEIKDDFEEVKDPVNDEEDKYKDESNDHKEDPCNPSKDQ